jgi:hypothetical protein
MVPNKNFGNTPDNMKWHIGCRSLVYTDTSFLQGLTKSAFTYEGHVFSYRFHSVTEYTCILLNYFFLY